MGYASTTDYLAKKLNWMSRRLKAINKPSDIKDWAEAMHCVYKIHADFSRNKELSTPPPKMTRMSWDYTRALCIDIPPTDKDLWDSSRIQTTFHRPVIKVRRSRTLKVASRGKQICKNILKKAQVSREPVVNWVGKDDGLTMEIDGDNPKPQDARYNRDMSKKT